jgi:carbon-monoxide dehydrogenase medium subunit
MRTPDGKANIAFTGVSSNAFRDADAEAALAGNPLNNESIEAAANASLRNVQVLSDHFASEEYRRHVAKVYLKKALEAVI